MRQVKKVLEEELPKLSEVYSKEYEKAVHMDGLFAFKAFIDNFFKNISDKLNQMRAFAKLIKQLHAGRIFSLRKLCNIIFA